jgi:hypothetical protein
MFLFLMIKGGFIKPASIIFSTLSLLFPTGNGIYSALGLLGRFYSIILIFSAIAEDSGPTV